MPPHGETITWGGDWYNLGLATLGNIVGGAVFVAGVYWVGGPKARALVRGVPEPSTNGRAAPAPELIAGVK